jgi:prepilin-type N-terminal cleavage/methylation domain-containing protein
MDQQHLFMAARIESIHRRETVMNSYRTGPRRAFTLVEIMIAVAIFTAVMIAIYSSWSAILRSTRIARDAAAEAQRSRVAVRAIENSLMSLQMSLANIKYDFFFADTSGDFATLSFVAHLSKSFPRSGDFGDQVVRRLEFTVEPGTNWENVLLLRQNPILFQTSAEEKENPLVLARNVKEFMLEFWGQRSKDWEPEWLYTNQLPKLIRFTLAFGRPNQRVIQPEDVITRVVSLAAMPVPLGMQTAGGLQARPANPITQPPPVTQGQPPVSTRSK